MDGSASPPMAEVPMAHPSAASAVIVQTVSAPAAGGVVAGPIHIEPSRVSTGVKVVIGLSYVLVFFALITRFAIMDGAASEDEGDSGSGSAAEDEYTREQRVYSQTANTFWMVYTFAVLIGLTLALLVRVPKSLTLQVRRCGVRCCPLHVLCWSVDSFVRVVC